MRACPVVARWLVAVCIVSITAGDIAAREPRRALRPLSPKEVRTRVETLPPDLIHEVAAMQHVLRPEELADLLSDTRPDRCRTWMDAWWGARDPIPTNDRNEAREEHEQRVLDAQAYFGRGAWPGWDDRGEVLIRYGAPAVRTRTPADVVEPGIYIPATELWYFSQFDIYARFADTGFNGYAQFREDVDAPVSERPRSDRRNLASVHNPDIPMDYMTVDMDPDGWRNLYGPTAGWSYEHFLDHLGDYYDLEDKVPAAYPFDFARMHIPAFVSVQSFRGGDGVDRVDVNTEFESTVRPFAVRSGSRRFVTTSVFWNRSGEEIARLARVDSIRTNAFAPAESLASVLNQLTMTLPPDTYRMAVTVEEEGTGRFATARRLVPCHAMDGGVAMSDLALARSIDAARDGSPFNRGPLEVVPRPSAQYRVGQPVPVYFEVYHVGEDADGARAYAVEYTIRPVPARRSLWSRLLGRGETPLEVRSGFEAVAMGPYDAVRMSAGTRNLQPGDYVLEVAVTEGATSRRVVRTTPFRLLK